MSEFTTENLNAEAKKNRELDYKKHSDPLFFKWQRGECDQSEWLGKIEEIKNKFKYV